MLNLTEKEIKLIENSRLEAEHEEYKYLNLLNKILTEGIKKEDRTGTGTISIYGTSLKFDLKESFPILTTKKVYWKGVVEELLWFIRGETDSKLLEAKGINIWKGNTSREFLDKKNLNYPEGEIGPGYGFQWRHWGGDYNSSKYISKFDEKDVKYQLSKLNFQKGTDQLLSVIEILKKNPNDRRMIISAWNVTDIDKMALPPCHLLFQFDVTDGYLNCLWYQRSNDFFLGSPFNISSYALLTNLICG
jgi:thymidylate synthase